MLCYRRISEDDARRTFQLARSNAKHFAIVFVAWAQSELLLGLLLIRYNENDIWNYIIYQVEYTVR